MNNRGDKDGTMLRVEELEYSYGERRAVKKASFQIRSGEIFGLLGPNGAGKTTTISCLSGLLGNWKGELWFRGESFQPHDRREDRERLGIVPQSLALYDELTGRENLIFFGRLYGLQGPQLVEAVDIALKISELTERANDLVGEYSGGMKRRLNLAVGDLHSPDILLLDEPTVGVDPQSRNHIFEALSAMKAQGRTLLYTTHYMEEAQRLCDRVAIMNDGSVIATGTPAELAQEAGKPEADLETVFLQLTGRSLRD